MSGHNSNEKNPVLSVEQINVQFEIMWRNISQNSKIVFAQRQLREEIQYFPNAGALPIFFWNI